MFQDGCKHIDKYKNPTVFGIFQEYFKMFQDE